MPLRSTTTYSPLNQGCSSLMRSVLTMREPVDADETPRVEPRLHVRHRLAEEMRLFAEVQTDVVAGGLDPSSAVRADYADGLEAQRTTIVIATRA